MSKHFKGRAFTLSELVTALAVSGVLFLALGNAIVIASKALPAKSDTMRTSVQAAQALDRIAGEIESAIYVSQLTATSIAFTVADRNSDGLPERIGYSWSGVAGAPLVRTYNGVAANVLDAVDVLNLVPNVRYVSETYPGPGVEDLLPSVLQDSTSILGGASTLLLGSTNTTNYGQYFAPTFGSDVIGWRPTQARISAAINKTPGTFRVQVRTASTSLVPTGTVLEEKVVNAALLPPLVMLPQIYNFSTLGRQAPGNPLSLAIMWDSGAGPGRFQGSASFPGLQRTSLGPTNWSYDTTRCLASSLTGVLMRAGASQTATTQYLQTVSMSLRAGSSSSPIAQTTSLASNTPEMVAALWELGFDQNPCTVDANGDGAADWALVSGNPFPMAGLSGGVWNVSGDGLVTRLANDFSGDTVVDVRMQSAAVGATAGFSINAAWSGGQCASLIAALVLQTDGTQTLTLSQATGSGTSEQLISYALLPSGALSLHLIVDPAAMGVAVSINGIQRGAFPFVRATVPGATPTASLFASGGPAKFESAKIRVLKAIP